MKEHGHEPFGVLQSARHVHFVGIGGAGMSGIAVLCLAKGLTVSGSDIEASPVTKRLTEHGATVHVGHSASHIAAADVVVRSSAIAQDNCELIGAARSGTPVVRRAEVLGWLMHNRMSVAVAGTHGKTTSTAILGNLAVSAGWDPTVVVGGRAHNVEGNVRVGRGDAFIVEADESDGSFLSLPCRVALVTNIDDDHLDHFKTMENLISHFVTFVNSVDEEGFVMVCRDDERLRRVLSRLRVPYGTYGLSALADYQLRDVAVEGFATSFSVRLPGGDVLGPLRVATPGEHSALNATGCIACAHRMGAPTQALEEGLATYRGVARRYEIRGEACGVTVVDDYAHHPAAIRAVLTATRKAAPGRRVVVVFQPHRQGRTALLAPALGEAFSDADMVVLLPVYRPTGDPDVNDDSSRSLYDELKRNHASVLDVACGPSLSEAVPVIASQLAAGDCLLTLGAGTVTRLGGMVLEYLNAGAA